jgi:hypothetical protein
VAVGASSARYARCAVTRTQDDSTDRPWAELSQLEGGRLSRSSHAGWREQRLMRVEQILIAAGAVAVSYGPAHTGQKPSRTASSSISPRIARSVGR